VKGLFNRFFDFLIYSNLYIAIAAVMFTMQSQVQLGMKPHLHPYLFLILFATLFEYNLHKFVAIFFYKHALKEEKFKWIAGHLKLFYFIVFSSVAGFIIAACFAKPAVLLALFPLGAITFLYSFPVYKNGVKLFRLREVPLAKIFIISFVWSATCILLPVIQAGLKVDLVTIAVLIFERFLFVFAITIPFDIRDMESDARSGLKTLPILIGEKKSIMISSLALVLFIGICSIHYFNTNQFYYATAFLLSGISTLFFVNNKKVRKLKEYHYGILDGTMILQGALVMAAYLAANLEA
jgi:4-hydroxybenzoate polyprenyltransferase